jgi:protein involved in ribonucleotide reduction
MLQQLFGVAAAEKKIPVFFARSYAKTAKEWGEKYKVALFQFNLKGEVKPMSKKAQELLAKRK